MYVFVRFGEVFCCCWFGGFLVAVYLKRKDIKELTWHYSLQYLFVIALVRIWKVILHIRSVFEGLSSLKFNPDKFLKHIFKNSFNCYTGHTQDVSISNWLCKQISCTSCTSNQKTSLLPFSCQSNNSRHDFPITLLLLTWPIAILCDTLDIFKVKVHTEQEKLSSLSSFGQRICATTKPAQ